jgi:TolB-like protein/Flp pilus assembly protein TadD
MSSGSPPAPPKPGELPPHDDRLESWKEIAAYLRREVRTVQRWEKKEGLPVHRLLHDKLGTVYASKTEIDAWWKERSRRLEQEPVEPPEDSQDATIDAQQKAQTRNAAAPSQPGIAPAVETAPAEEKKKPPIIARPVKRLAKPVTMPLGIVVLLIALAVYFAWKRYWPWGDAHAGKVMIAVLPFDNLSDEPGQEYLSQGLTEEMISQLSVLSPQNLGVVGRQSALQFGKSTASAKQIGQTLKVDYLLDGSVRLANNRVKITAELIDVRTEQQLWSRSYERNLEDVLALENEVAQQIASEIRIQLSPSEKARLAAPRPVVPDAFQAYLKGRYAMSRRDLEGMQKSIQFFQQAIALDPKYALAFTGLADTYNLLAFYSVMPPRDVYPKSKDAAQKALALDDSLAEAHAALADVSLHFDYDWKRAENHFLEAIRRNPNYPTAQQWYAAMLALEGRSEESRRHMELALRLDPVSAPISTDLALVDFYAGNFDAAIEKCRRSMEIEPNYHMAHFWLARAYLQKKMVNEAKQEFQKAIELQPNNLLAVSLLGHAMAVSGDRAGALATIRKFETESRKRYIAPTLIALVYAGLDDKERTFEWAEKAYRKRDPLLTRLKADPILSNLRQDPHFQDLVKRVGP